MARIGRSAQTEDRLGVVRKEGAVEGPVVGPAGGCENALESAVSAPKVSGAR